MSRAYTTFDYPNAQIGSKTLLTGIRGDDETLYICGFYQFNDEQTSFIYKGGIDGKGSWYNLNYPGSKVTSLYGPAILDNNKIRIVGNYTTAQDPKVAIGCMYEGLLDGSGIWTKILPISDSKGIIAHSTMGDLVVGNYISDSSKQKSFVYNVITKKYHDIVKPGAKSLTSYGVWHIKNHHYIICGGLNSKAHTVLYNSKTRKLSDWSIYSFPNARVTHFDGITEGSNHEYNLTGDYILNTDNNQGAFFATIDEGCEFIQWSNILYPNYQSISGNSIYKSTVIGVYPSETTVHGYISTLL